MKKGASFRRSFKFKKDSNKGIKQEPLIAVSEGSVEKEDNKEEQEEVMEEIEEGYELSEIPPIPLSGTN